MRAHASEGRLFRTVLVDSLEHCGLRVRVVLEREALRRWRPSRKSPRRQPG